MKGLLALFVVALLSVGASACGGSGKSTQTAAELTSSGTTPAKVPVTASTTVQTSGYLNDGDNDPSNDNDKDNNTADNDNDAPEDNLRPENGRYHDKDDNIAIYGPPASASEMRAIVALVKRYYAVAAAGDGAKACSMMYSTLAEAVPEDYGEPPGPSYLRGKTCSEVMARLFKHSQAKLTDNFAVTDVRIKGNLAFVLLGSKTVPASGLFTKREHGVWKIDSLLGNPLT